MSSTRRRLEPGWPGTDQAAAAAAEAAAAAATNLGVYRACEVREEAVNAKAQLALEVG